MMADGSPLATLPLPVLKLTQGGPLPHLLHHGQSCCPHSPIRLSLVNPLWSSGKVHSRLCWAVTDASAVLSMHFIPALHSLKKHSIPFPFSSSFPLLTKQTPQHPSSTSPSSGIISQIYTVGVITWHHLILLM